MQNDRDGELRQYEARLRREEMNWRARFDYVVHSDRAAINLGINTVKTAVLMNAGALVALLAFASQQSGKDPRLVSAVLASTSPFVWGLISAAAAFAVAYLYQSAITIGAQRMLDEVSAMPIRQSLQSLKWLHWLTWSTKIAMVGLTFV